MPPFKEGKVTLTRRRGIENRAMQRLPRLNTRRICTTVCVSLMRVEEVVTKDDEQINDNGKAIVQLILTDQLTSIFHSQ
jgi:histone H3/H4